MRNCSIASIVLGTLLLAGGEKVGAQEIRRYEPPTPTLSPYLNLLGPQGVLPNYYSLVRPLQQQRQLRQDVVGFERRQTLVNREIEQQFAQPQGISPTGTAGRFMDPGTNAAFFNSRPYFNQFQRRGIQRQR